MIVLSTVDKRPPSSAYAYGFVSRGAQPTPHHPVSIITDEVERVVKTDIHGFFRCRIEGTLLRVVSAEEQGEVSHSEPRDPIVTGDLRYDIRLSDQR